MDFYLLLLIAVALSLDAFGVALSIGLNKNVKFGHKVKFSFSFGFFQFLFSILGFYLGFLFNTYIVLVPKIIGGIIIAVVGVFMIKEGIDKKDEDFLLKPGMYFTLGISVSIDAMVIGFTAFNNVKSFNTIFMYTVFIGIVTFIITMAAFLFSNFLKKIEMVNKYADYLGGIILILFGIKMMFF